MVATQKVPILNLKAQYQQIANELEQSVLTVLRSGNYILGENVSKLEAAISEICGCSWGVGVANGTDALLLALWSLDIGPGDEVITPPFTFAATTEAILLRGAKPVFVDVCPSSYNIDVSKISSAITKKTKAILPVHLYGQSSDMLPISELAQQNNLSIIEDNAQAIGGQYQGKPVGSLGTLACISFYPTKNLGAAGDAGMIVTNNESLANRLKVLRAHGAKNRYFHDELGVNSRLDEIQAAILLCKVNHLPTWNSKRRQVAQWYEKHLAGIDGLILPKVIPQTEHVWHQYTVRITSDHNGLRRDQFKEELAKLGVDSMCYYPVPLHLQLAYSSLGYKKSNFPVAEKLASEVLSLPMYPELSEDQVSYVASAIKEVFAAAKQVSTHAIPHAIPAGL